MPISKADDHSAMLRLLEDRLGYSLFTRERRRLELTVNGRALLPEVNNALLALHSLQQLAKSMRLGAPRRVVIGAVASVGASILPQAIALVQEQQPHTHVVLKAGTGIEVVQMAAEQRVELGVILGSGASENVGFEHLADLGLVCVMRADHRFSTKTEVSLDELAGVPYIGHSRNLPIGAITAQRLESAGHAYEPSIEVVQFSAACAMVEACGSVAILESLSAMYAERHGLIVRPMSVTSDLSLNLVWPLSLGLTPLAQVLANQLRISVKHLDAI